MSDSKTTFSQGEALYNASQMTRNDGWLSVDRVNSPYSINISTAKSLENRGYLERSPDGFAFRITDKGKDFVKMMGNDLPRQGRIMGDREAINRTIRNRANEWTLYRSQGKH